MALAPLCACAPIQNSAELLTAQQSGAVKATCTKVMRLEEGEAHWEGCVSSLSNSLAEKIQGTHGAVAYSDCGQAGLKRDTADFSRCVLDREKAQMASYVSQTGAPFPLDAAFVKAADDNPKGYFLASFDLRRSRELYSCAELGLTPNSGSFAQCVADLDSNLFEIDHPLT
jgi:hypothetical protein